jgi:hypothetical protein
MLSLALVIGAFKIMPSKNYALALAVFYTVANVFFIYLYLKQAAVSMEGRHFRMLGLLALPGVIYLASKFKATKIIFGVIWIGFFYWEAKTFMLDFKYNLHAPRASSGLSQQAYDQPTLDTLVKLDNAQKNKAIFVVPNPDISIEIQHNRLITLTFDDMDINDIKAARYTGNGGIIYMLMPVRYVKNGMANLAVKSFVNYHHFKQQQLSKSFYLYTAYN